MRKIVDRARRFLRTSAAQANQDVFDRLGTQGMKTLAEEVRYEAGLIKETLHRQTTFSRPREAGYRVYSQFDEDGILQYLLRHVEIADDTFVEIGIEDYRESNTRFLLEKDNWKGVLIDCVDDALGFLHGTGLYGWRTIDFIQSFVDRDSVEQLLAHVPEDVGVLSLDIDGVDYHIWEAMRRLRPRIVLLEYQPNFGPSAAITVPYRPDFNRPEHHYSNLCFGASLSAWVHLAAQKGYALVDASSGHNAFFVRRDVLGSLAERAAEECFVEARYRDSRDPEFRNTYLTTMAEKRRAMADARILDVVTGHELAVRDVFPEAR